MTVLSGRCLCKAVTFTVDTNKLRTGHCHCESCRRAASSPVTTFVCVAKVDVRFEGDALAHYESSPGVIRGFCSRCGSPMSFEGYKRPDDIDLYVASLDDASGLAIDEHWHWNERVSWLTCQDDLPKLEG